MVEYTLSNLCKIFRWEGNETLSSLLFANRLMHVSKSLVQRISRFPGSIRATALADLSNLTDEGLHCVLQSPRIMELLHYSDSDQEIVSLLARESRSAANLREGGWSALGDQWLGPFPKAGSDALIELAKIRGLSPYRLPIDLSLPELLRNPSAGLVNTRQLTAWELKGLSLTIAEALSEMELICPPAYKFILEHTSNIVLREESAPDVQVRSASSPITIGRSVLLNVKQATALRMIQECLIHEAVHACISSFELTTALVIGIGSALVTSPWTGNVIPLRACVHASFVWYALFMFERRAASADKLTDERCERIYQGFNRLDPGWFGGVDEACLTAMNHMKEEVVKT